MSPQTPHRPPTPPPPLLPPPSPFAPPLPPSPLVLSPPPPVLREAEALPSLRSFTKRSHLKSVKAMRKYMYSVNKSILKQLGLMGPSWYYVSRRDDAHRRNVHMAGGAARAA